VLWVVTGASSGIGLELSRLLCLKGFRVVGVARSRERLEGIRSELGNCFNYIVADLSTIDGVRRVVESVKSFDAVDVLVNNAGFGLYKTVLEHSAEDVASMAMTNFVTPIVLVKELLPHMKKGSAVVMVITAGIHVGHEGAANLWSHKNSTTLHIKSPQKRA
jgi:short-subunit dehydrogenase